MCKSLLLFWLTIAFAWITGAQTAVANPGPVERDARLFGVTDERGGLRIAPRFLSIATSLISPTDDRGCFYGQYVESKTGSMVVAEAYAAITR
jgi:hypothetical protein